MNEQRKGGRKEKTNKQMSKCSKERKREWMSSWIMFTNAWCQPQVGYWKFRGGGGSKGNYELKLDFPEGWG